MNVFVNILTVALVLAAGISLAVGIMAIGDEQDVQAFYWLALGALLLKSGVEMVRPSRSS